MLVCHILAYNNYDYRIERADIKWINENIDKRSLNELIGENINIWPSISLDFYSLQGHPLATIIKRNQKISINCQTCKDIEKDSRMKYIYNLFDRRKQ